MFRVCKRCGSGNRVPVRHLADVGRCGWCYGALPPHHTPISLDEAGQLDGILRELRVPVLLALSPRGAADRLGALAASLAGRAVVVQLSEVAAEVVSARYALDPRPRFVVFRGGRLLHQRGDLLEPSVLAPMLTSS
jgi:hypothetical protein